MHHTGRYYIFKATPGYTINIVDLIEKKIIYQAEEN